ncbi:MAG TPA: hypothetical protein VF840_14260 [Terriglobales bacterium]
MVLFTRVYDWPLTVDRYTLKPVAFEPLACQFNMAVCCTEAVPEPLSVTVAGEFVALLTNETLPEAVPLLDGVKVKLAFWLAAAASVNGKVSPLTPNPEPVKLAEETVTDELPVLLSLTVWLADRPTVTDPNATEVGEADKSTVVGALMITFARALDLGSATLVATTEAVPAVDGAV